MQQPPAAGAARAGPERGVEGSGAGGRPPQPSRAGGVCGRRCVRSGGCRGAAGTMWAAGPRRRAGLPSAGHGPRGPSCERPRGARARRPHPRPTRVPGAPRAAGAAPPSFLLAKLHRDPPGLRAGGRPRPVGPTARAFVWALRARRGQTETGRGASRGRRGPSGTRASALGRRRGGSCDPGWRGSASGGFRRKGTSLVPGVGRNSCVKQSPGCVYGVNGLWGGSRGGSRGRKLGVLPTLVTCSARGRGPGGLVAMKWVVLPRGYPRPGRREGHPKMLL